MIQKKTLSYKYNMAMGLIPVVIFFLLCEFLPHDVAIYISTACALSASLLAHLTQKKQPIPLLLYGTTGMLVLLSLTHLLVHCSCNSTLYAITMEISVAIPAILILINRKRFVRLKNRSRKDTFKHLFSRSAEACIVSARLTTILVALHLLIIFICLLFFRPFGEGLRLVLFRIAPPTLFVLIILLNHLILKAFNKLMERTPFLPIVNKEGNVIGRCLAEEARKHPGKYLHPVIRLAVSTHGMVYLAPRPQSVLTEAGKMDISLETLLYYGESLEEGLNRLLREEFPEAPIENLHFHFMYHHQTTDSNRLVYFFTLSLENEEQLRSGQKKDGKLWTFRQIDYNLNRNYFSSSLKYEYDELKQIIYTREKYKEP